MRISIRLAPLLLAALATTGASDKPSTSMTGWTTLDYGALVERRSLTHSGESVGVLLRRLEGRPLPPPGERPQDLMSHKLLEPFLESYAFVLPDALDSLERVPDVPRVEVGALWQPGEAQPGWAELLRSRVLLVESDGEGRFRLFLPWSGKAEGEGIPPDSSLAAQEAWQKAWPVLRHVFASERERLGRAIEAEVHAYVHFPARSVFELGLGGYRARVEDTRGGGDRPPLDLKALESFLDRGLRLEGARLESDGTLRLLGSETSRRPSLLGRPLSLADFAVAYRAVFHGGLSEPYMSLDRGFSPQTSIVNYGGRLEDTSLGWVSLLSDIRFKTFSLGIDVTAGADVRADLRGSLPEFRAHIERFAADARTQGVLGQQTRLWFYPDDVDLTLSPESDVLVMRRVRMTAASERVEEGTWTGSGERDPPWTLDTVAAINRDYEKLVPFFPELADLDEAVRLLSLFTWLREAQAGGLLVPDLDALLTLELPALPTPRRFPQLLTSNALPPPGGAGPVEVFDQTEVGEALDRLQPQSGPPLPAVRRFRRALLLLDGRWPEQAAAAQEMQSSDPMTLDESAADLLAFRAERLRMHRLVVSTLAASDRDALERREKAGETVRVFSVGIGGIDLGMGQALARARRRAERLAGSGLEAASSGEGEEQAPPQVTVREEWRRDPTSLPKLRMPDHGRETLPGTASRHLVQKGSTTVDKRQVRFILTVMGKDGPHPRSRRLILDSRGQAESIERLDTQPLLRYRLVQDGSTLRARRLESGPQWLEPRTPAPGSLPAGLALLELGSPPVGADADASPVPLRLRGVGGRQLEASFPRAILQRLLLGREADPLAGQPLPGLTPASQFLGDIRRVLVLQRPEHGVAPWEAPSDPLAGEEDPAQVAAALGRWWSSEAGGSSGPRVAVGTDSGLSPARWEKAPRPGEDALLLLPPDAFPPGPSAALRDRLSAAWKGGRVEGQLEGGPAPSFVILVSAEAPGLLGPRLRELARQPALEGKLLAVWSLAGPLRRDLPASLLGEGKLAGIGVAESLPVGLPRVEKAIAALRGSLAGRPPGGLRVEELPGPFLWYF